MPCLSGSSWMKTLVPGDPRGVRLRSKAPCSWAWWADSCGLTLEPHSKLKVVCAC